MQRAFRFPNTPHGVTFRHIRAYAVSPTHSQDLRARLMVDVKTALKSKDSITASTLRSVLADVQAADKVHKDGQIGVPAIRALVAKGIAKRHDVASQYDRAKRPDLAAKERREAEILQNLLPPAMSETQIDEILKRIIDSLPSSGSQRSLGQVFKVFYAQVDKSLVRPDMLKQRAQILLAYSQSSSPPTS